MSIPLPNLDDRAYDDLVAELRALIPSFSAGQWTDHNPTDPGITLVELFAWLGEAMIYRLNRITPASELRFLELLHPAVLAESQKQVQEAKEPQDPLEVARGLFRTEWRKKYRAVTQADYEHVVRTEFEDCVARVLCLPEWNPESQPERQQASHVSVVVLPKEGRNVNLDRVRKLLDKRRLIGTKVHVVRPSFVRVCVQTTVFALIGEDRVSLRKAIISNLRENFSPWPAKAQSSPRLLQPDAAGWPFGRAVYPSEVYQVIDATPGVDYVEHLVVWGGGDCRDASLPKQDAADSVQIKAWELVDFRPEDIAIEMRPFPRSTITGRT